MATEILRPNAAGDATQLNSSSGANYACVDEAVADDFGTYVTDGGGQGYLRDLYGLPDHTSGSGKINSVKVYYRVFGGNTPVTKSIIKTGGTEYNGATNNPPESWTNYNDTWNTNPGGGDWTWEQIDALQVGVGSSTNANGNFITQVYVEVDYTVPEIFYQDTGQGSLGIIGTLDITRMVSGFVGQGVLTIVGELAKSSKRMRIMGQSSIAIFGTLDTHKIIHLIVGQGVTRIKGTFKTTLDRILKIHLFPFAAGLEISCLDSKTALTIICKPIEGGNMANFSAGETVICPIEVRDSEGAPKDPATSMKITIINPTGDTVVGEKDMNRDEQGEYHYDYNSLTTDKRGTYVVRYTAVDGTRVRIARTNFTIE